MKLKLSLFLLAFFAFLAFISCSSTNGECDDDECESNVSSSGGGGSSSSGGGDGSSSSGNGGGNSSSGGGGLDGVENAIEIKYNNGSAPTVTKPDDEVRVQITGENVVVKLPDSAYNIVLSGITANGSLKIYGEFEKGLYLNGVSITNANGPAINIQDGKKASVHLVDGKTNILSDGPTYSGIPVNEQAKGTFFSEGKLEFSGGGSLEVRGKANHAIAVDNDFEMKKGTGKITVSEAKNDGIHANDMIEIKGGTLEIASVGDAIQSESSDSLKITGGIVKVTTTGAKSHGITSEGKISISENADIYIEVKGNGSKGIKSTNWTEILGGTIVIKTSGGQDQTDLNDISTAAGIKVDADLFIEGGSLTIKSTGDKAKGINALNIEMTDGNVDIEANDDGIKVHGVLTMNGGSISVESIRGAEHDIDGAVEQTGGTINGKTNW